MSEAVLALEEIAARGWPAPHSRWLGRWLLRAGDGWTRRANSVLVLGEPGMDLDDALALTAAWYAEHGLPPVFAVPMPAQRSFDDALAERGWVNELVADVLTADLTPPVDALRDNGVRLSERPPPGWDRVYRGSAPLPPVAMRILTAPPVVTFASIVDGAAGGSADGAAGVDGALVVATGRGVLTDDWLGIAAIEVAPTHRGRGLASRVTKALQEWGSRHGARRCYLQVGTDNAAALGLYAALGFTRHHTYRQRVPGAVVAGDYW